MHAPRAADGPRSRDIRLGGVALTAADPDDLHQAAALVFQESFLFADTVRENLAMGAAVTDDELWAALDIARARAFVERLPRDLDEVIGGAASRCRAANGSDRARPALLRRPRLLLLDDATSAVDATSSGPSSIACATASRRRRSSSPTVSTIALADRVLLLDGGRIGGRHPPGAAGCPRLPAARTPTKPARHDPRHHRPH